MILNLKAHTAIKLLIIILKPYESHPTTIGLQFYLLSHYKSIPPFSLSHTKSFRQRCDGGSSRLSNMGPSGIFVDLDSKVSFITICRCPHSY